MRGLMILLYSVFSASFLSIQPASAEANDSSLELISVNGRPTDDEISEEVRKKLRHDFGGPFLIYRDAIQEDLKLTTEQKDKLEQHLRELAPEAIQFFQTMEGMEDRAREKAMREQRAKSRAKLTAMLEKTLNPNQRIRLRQVELHKEGLFGSGAEVWDDLHLTRKQKQQFMESIQRTQKAMESLMKQIQTGANPEEIRPRAMKLRVDLQTELESRLTDVQRKQWQEMLGKPIAMEALFDH
jgi:translation initiation factor 2 alpha subunit (eIF-2alpha)